MKTRTRRVPPPAPMEKLMRMPQGNSQILALLRSPAHRLASGMVIELRYTGRRTGREYVLPVQYAGAGERLVIRPQAVGRSTWWRNFRTPTPVTVRLGGRIRHGTGHLVTAAQPAWEQARTLYGSRWRRSAHGMTGPLVVISLAAVRTPEHES